MSSRILEVLMVALLIMVTLGVAFQFQNQQTLQRIHEELRDQRHALAEATAPVRGRPFDERATAAAEPARREVRLRDGSEPPRDGNDGRQAQADPSASDADTPDTGDTVAERSERDADATDTPSAADPGDAIAVSPIPDDITADVGATAAATGDQPRTDEPDTDPAADADSANVAIATADDDSAVAEAADAVAAFDASASASASEPEVDRAWVQHEELVVATVRRLLDGDYAWVTQRFTPQMTRRLRREDIARALDPVRDEHGAFEEVAQYENITHGLDEGLHAFRVFVNTTRGGELTFTITVDDNGEIDGLFMR